MQTRAKRQRKTICTPQPEYELAVSFAKQVFQSPNYKNYESDLYRHFSALLSTDTNKITVSKENFRELVTIQRRYPRCELKIVPRLEPASINQSDQKLPAPSSDPTQTEEVDELQETEDNDEILKGAADVAGSPNVLQKHQKNQSKVQNWLLHLRHRNLNHQLNRLKVN